MAVVGGSGDKWLGLETVVTSGCGWRQWWQVAVVGDSAERKLCGDQLCVWVSGSLLWRVTDAKERVWGRKRRIFEGEGCVLDGFEKFFDRSVMGP